MRGIALAAIALGLGCPALSARGAVVINEVYYSPENPDEGRQFIELRSTTGGVESLANLWLLEIDGDAGNVPGLVDNPGTILTAINIGAYSTGPNGFFLWRDSDLELDNSAQVGVQGPGATVVQVLDVFPGRVDLGFERDPEPGPSGPTNGLENDISNFLLVEGFTGSVGLDLDNEANAIKGDGVFNFTPWTRVLDAVSARETVDPGFLYAASVGGTNATLSFGPDILFRDPVENMWAFFDSGDGEGEVGYPGLFYANDGTSFLGTSDAGYADGRIIYVGPDSKYLYATPGSENRTGVGGLYRGDVDHDGDVDAADIDLLYENFGSTSSDFIVASNFAPAGQADVDYLVRTVLHTDYGDADLDRDIDGADFLAWQRGVGPSAGWATGDFKGNNGANAADLAEWRTRFGFGAAATVLAAGVPEPSSLAMSLACAGVLALRRRRR